MSDMKFGTKIQLLSVLRIQIKLHLKSLDIHCNGYTLGDAVEFFIRQSIKVSKNAIFLLDNGAKY